MESCSIHRMNDHKLRKSLQTLIILRYGENPGATGPGNSRKHGYKDCVESTASALKQLGLSAEWIKCLLLMIFSLWPVGDCYSQLALRTFATDFTVKIINRSDQKNAALYGKVWDRLSVMIRRKAEMTQNGAIKIQIFETWYRFHGNPGYGDI